MQTGNPFSCQPALVYQLQRLLLGYPSGRGQQTATLAGSNCLRQLKRDPLLNGLTSTNHCLIERGSVHSKFTLKLSAPAATLVATYAPITQATSESYIFPILDPIRHFTPTQIKNRLRKVLGQVNQGLKILAEMAGITTPLTTYVARHSFATALKLTGENTAIRLTNF